ncbi:MAG TPA: glycosyltransferase family A protein [Candidatus Sulfotelmatobacter sp.]|nr:glycosyltransferase family A protein [Candidatus Sulfotelmatobacter sp.]
MSSTPRVSVIVPCYNSAQFVGDTLQSIFAQTYHDYEVVLINDGSPDTPQLEQVLAPWMARISYVKTENQGVAAARNNGIRAAKGELIAMLDSDDLWEPNCLEVQVRNLDENPSADIVYPRFTIFEDRGKPDIPGTPSQGEVTFISLLQDTCSVPNSGVLARRAALERAGLYDPALKGSEDFDLWLRCLKSGSRIIHHDQVLLHYRRRLGSLSSNDAWMCGNAIQVLTRLRTGVQLTNEERQVLESAIRRYEGNKLLYEGKYAFIAGDISSAVDRLQQAKIRLDSRRLGIIVFLIRLMPKVSRSVYLWRLQQRGDSLLRTDVRHQHL